MSVWYGPEFEGSIRDEETQEVLIHPTPRSIEARARSFELGAARLAQRTDEGGEPLKFASFEIRKLLELACFWRTKNSGWPDSD